MDRRYRSMGRKKPGRNVKTGGEQKMLPVLSSWSRLRSCIGHGKLMKGQKFAAHAQCHVICRCVVKNDYISRAPFKVKSSTCYSASYMRRTRGQKRLTISEVAADWHELMIPQRTMRPYIARVNEQWAVSRIRWKLGPRLLLITNRKSHTPFQMRWKSSTLDDLEGHWQPVRSAILATAGLLVTDFNEIKILGP